MIRIVNRGIGRCAGKKEEAGRVALLILDDLGGWLWARVANPLAFLLEVNLLGAIMTARPQVFAASRLSAG